MSLLLLLAGSGGAAPPAGAPTNTFRIDWANDGTFAAAIDSLAGRVLDFGLSRGRSADFSGEAIGQLSMVLDNFDDAFTPDRNWHDNPSFEAGTAGWSVAAIAGLTAAATSISQVADSGAGAGTKAGEAVLTATLNSGVTFPIPYRFLSGVTYAVTVKLKSESGALTVRAGLASAGTPADIASSATDITTSYAAYTFTWTPSADRTDGVFFVRTTAAAAATVRIDAIGVNPGSTPNPYLEAPTKGQLVPGKPVHAYSTHGGTDYPLFYGFIERLTPNPADRTVAVTCYDVLRRLSEVDVVVPPLTLTGSYRSARDFRVAVLEEFERGARNLLANPSFETNTTGWTVVNGTITRITTDAAADAGGTCCGEFVWSSGTAAVSAAAYMAPLFHAGQVYRASLWIRAAAGTPQVTLGLGYGVSVSAFIERTITLSTTWTRYTLTYTPSATQPAGTPVPNGPLQVYIRMTSGTIRVDGVQITRGQALYPYADEGAGRWPNWCGSGSFDISFPGWCDAFLNLCGNPSFEVNTTGWTSGADSFVSAGTIARVVADPKFGTCHATVAGTGGGPTYGGYYVITGTFKAGVAYDVSCWIKDGTVASAPAKFGIGSNGTPADKVLVSQTTTASWALCSGTWTPSADRTDVHLYIGHTGIGNIKVDGFMVTRRVSTAAPASYSDTGPGGGGQLPTSTATVTTAKYGAASMSVTAPATAAVGKLYDFAHAGPYFVAGKAYTFSLWVNPSSNMPYKLGLGANAGDGSWDEASATGTAPASTWTKLTVTWTPSADRSAAGVLDVVGYLYQTDATARTFLVDGARAIPGSTADDYEMAQWGLAVESSDLYATSASLSGSALSCLSQLNALALVRHWIEPELAAPWYTYRTDDRDSLATKASAETFDEDMADFSPADIDRSAIVNVVPVSYTNPTALTEYYGDPESTGGPTGDGYGPRPSQAINGAAFFPNRTIPDVVGPALVARYKDPRARPTMKAVNRWPSQLQRELNDLITVNFARLGIRGARYLILRIDTKISESGQRWETSYVLEEHAY